MAAYTIMGIPNDEYNDFRVICLQKGKTVKAVIKKMIHNYVQKNKKGD